MKHQIHPSIVNAIVGLVLSWKVIAAAAATADAAMTELPQGRGVDDNHAASTTSLLRRQLPLDLHQQPNGQLKDSDTTTKQRLLKRAKAKKKKQKNGRVKGGGGGSCTPDEQRQCCSKYKKPNFNMACKALGCKTTRCPRFYSEPISLNDGDDSSSGEEEPSLARQFVNHLNNDDEDEASSSCESGCNSTQQYDTHISFTYQDGDIVESDCMKYRCREYPYSLWCTNELYMPGMGEGGIAWEMIGPCSV